MMIRRAQLIQEMHPRIKITMTQQLLLKKYNTFLIEKSIDLSQ